MKKFSFIFICFYLMTGCASTGQYRTEYNLIKGSTPDAKLISNLSAIQQVPTNSGSNYILGFIEFDDQGHLHQRSQMNAVLDNISQFSKEKDLLIVVFAHGWKGNSSPKQENIQKFRNLLVTLSDNEQALGNKLKSKYTPRQVVGVYLGWRGESLDIPYLDNITFWDRKNTAEKVGRGDVTEVLSRLEQVKNDKLADTNCKSATRLVVVGHSFGGLIIHNALNEIIERRFVSSLSTSKGSSNIIDGFGNLIVLINPAFEAQQFSSISDMSAERQADYSTKQYPLLAILTSEADYATKYAFPLGRQLSTLFESENPYPRNNNVTKEEEHISESQANITAVGHFEPFQTHLLYPKATINTEDLKTKFEEDASLNALAVASNDWDHDEPGSVIPFGNLLLERSKKSAGRNPYLVIKVNKNLIKDHSDIDEPAIIEFIKELVLISTLTEESKKSIYKSYNLN